MSASAEDHHRYSDQSRNGSLARGHVKLRATPADLWAKLLRHSAFVKGCTMPALSAGVQGHDRVGRAGVGQASREETAEWFEAVSADYKRLWGFEGLHFGLTWRSDRSTEWGYCCDIRLHAARRPLLARHQA
jgi:hypothetical protein